MARLLVDSEYRRAVGLYAFVVKPEPAARIVPFTSEPQYASHEIAVMAGIKYLESQGIRNIDLCSVVELLEPPREDMRHGAGHWR